MDWDTCAIRRDPGQTDAQVAEALHTLADQVAAGELGVFDENRSMTVRALYDNAGRVVGFALFAVSFFELE